MWGIIVTLVFKCWTNIIFHKPNLVLIILSYTLWIWVLWFCLGYLLLIPWVRSDLIFLCSMLLKSLLSRSPLRVASLKQKDIPESPGNPRGFRSSVWDTSITSITEEITRVLRARCHEPGTETKYIFLSMMPISLVKLRLSFAWITIAVFTPQKLLARVIGVFLKQ